MTSPSKSFDRIAGTYDATRGGMERGRRMAADLNPHFSPEDKVLEIGIGTGAVALGLVELGRWVGGIDIAPKMIKQAQERIGSTVVVGDAHRIPIDTSSLSNVYAVLVMHLVDVEVVMGEVARVLHPGGRFLVSQGQKREPTAVDEIVAEMNRALTPKLREERVSKRIKDGANHAGLSLTAEILGESAPYGVTPEKEARRIEDRTYSGLWDVDDLRWESIVQPALDKLRALPEPDVRIISSTRARIWVFEN